jgi:hypothetical protein
MTEKYLSLAYQDLSQHDGLLVMARGIGLRSLFVRFLRDYCYSELSLSIVIDLLHADCNLSPESHTSRNNDQKGIVFCINMLESGRYDDSAGFTMENINNALLSEGIMPFHLPKVSMIRLC